MINPRVPLTACVASVTTLTPLLMNCVVKARHVAGSRAARDAHLDQAIRHAEQLLADLKLQKARLAGGDRESDVA